MSIAPFQITRDGSVVEVSSATPFSQHNRWLLVLVPGGRVALHDGDIGEHVQMLPGEITHHSEPRWSRTDENRFYFVAGNKLMGCVLGAHPPPHGETAMAVAIYTEHEFAEYEAINSTPDGEHHIGGESDISADGDHFIMCGTYTLKNENRVVAEVFVYEISTGRKLELQQQSKPIDGLKLVGNTPILSRGANGPDDGIFVLEGGKERKICDANGHACPWGDHLVWCASNSPSIDRNSVVVIDVATDRKRVLREFESKYGMHLSACDKFVLASVFEQGGGQLWKLFHYSDPELACEFATVLRNYDSQPKASLSRDGSRCVWNVDDGQQVNVWMLRLDGASVKIEDPASDLHGWRAVNFAAPGMEGRRYRLDMEVVNGRLVGDMWEK